MGESNLGEGTSREVLDYEGPRKRSAVGAWILLAVSFVPVLSLAAFSDIMGGGMQGFYVAISRPFAQMFSRQVAIGLAAVLFVWIPIFISFLLAWMAWQGFRRAQGRMARAGRVLAWSSMMLFGGMALVVMFLLPLVWWITGL